MSASSVMVITNFFGVHVNAANVGVGLQNPDGGYNVSGTLIGLGQTVHSAMDFALTGSGRLTTALPWAGGALGLFGALESYNKINQSFAKNESPSQSDIAGVLGGTAAMAGGAALILGGGVIVPISVVAGVAAGTWQIVASAKSWTVDDAMYPVQTALTDLQKTQVSQALQDFAGQKAFTDTLSNAVGGGTFEPVSNSNLWNNLQVFEPANSLAQSLENAIDQALQAAKDAGKSVQQAVEVISKALSALGEGFGQVLNKMNFSKSGIDAFITQLQNLFQTAFTIDPLILDLNGDGVQTTRLSKSTTTGVHFNLDAKGFAENTAWVDAHDGLLVRDLNGDGKITSGRELFGNYTQLKNGSRAANGFEALKEIDNNNDGVVDSNDVAFNTLKVWKDINTDGITDTDELLTLNQAGVKSLKVAYTQSTAKDTQGNAHAQLGSFIAADSSKCLSQRLGCAIGRRWRNRNKCQVT